MIRKLLEKINWGIIVLIMNHSYPAQMIPGCHITIHTSARNDRDARLLLSACGIPFYGKLVN